MRLGISIPKKVKTRRFSEQRTKFYAVQVALAFGYLHSKKIIYRDLKPENFLFENKSPESKIILIDFGTALVVEDDKSVTTFAHAFVPVPVYKC